MIFLLILFYMFMINQIVILLCQSVLAGRHMNHVEYGGCELAAPPTVLASHAQYNNYVYKHPQTCALKDNCIILYDKHIIFSHLWRYTLSLQMFKKGFE